VNWYLVARIRGALRAVAWQCFVCGHPRRHLLWRRHTFVTVISEERVWLHAATRHAKSWVTWPLLGCRVNFGCHGCCFVSLPCCFIYGEGVAWAAILPTT
jgi:hypothetical protein